MQTSFRESVKGAVFYSVSPFTDLPLQIVGGVQKTPRFEMGGSELAAINLEESLELDKKWQYRLTWLQWCAPPFKAWDFKKDQSS